MLIYIHMYLQNICTASTKIKCCKLSILSKNDTSRLFPLTVSKYLCKDPFLVVGINVVGGFPCLVGPIQQTTVSRVTQKKLSDSLASSPQRNMEPCISSLKIVENVHEAYIQMSYSLIYGFLYNISYIQLHVHLLYLKIQKD